MKSRVYYCSDTLTYKKAQTEMILRFIYSIPRDLGTREKRNGRGETHVREGGLDAK